MWTIAITIGLFGLITMFLVLAKTFSKEKYGIKTLLTMASFLFAIIISQSIKLIIEENASGDELTHLTTMANVCLTVTITIFSFFMAYYLVMFTISYINSLKESKRGIEI